MMRWRPSPSTISCKMDASVKAPPRISLCDLPDEILVMILKRLSMGDIDQACRNINRRFNHIVNGHFKVIKRSVDDSESFENLKKIINGKSSLIKSVDLWLYGDHKDIVPSPIKLLAPLAGCLTKLGVFGNLRFRSQKDEWEFKNLLASHLAPNLKSLSLKDLPFKWEYGYLTEILQNSPKLESLNLTLDSALDVNEILANLNVNATSLWWQESDQLFQNQGKEQVNWMRLMEFKQLSYISFDDRVTVRDRVFWEAVQELSSNYSLKDLTLNGIDSTELSVLEDIKIDSKANSDKGLKLVNLGFRSCISLNDLFIHPGSSLSKLLSKVEILMVEAEVRHPSELIVFVQAAWSCLMQLKRLSLSVRVPNSFVTKLPGIQPSARPHQVHNMIINLDPCLQGEAISVQTFHENGTVISDLE